MPTAKLLPSTRRFASALTAVLGLLLAGCSSDSPIQVGADVVVRVTSGGGHGTGVVTSDASTPSSFVIACDIEPDPVGETGTCDDSFPVAGGGGAVSITAIPGANRLLTAWTGCDNPPGSTSLSCALSFEIGAGSGREFDVTARFDLDPTAPCNDVKTTVPLPVGGVGTGPATPSDPSPAYGAEALTNASFEQVVTVGSVGQLLPTAYGYWQGDLNARVASQQGIDPDDGEYMVQFIASGIDPGPTGTAEVLQLVKVSHFGQDVADGRVRATVRARFNRVAGCEETDVNMLMVVAAMEGPPSEALASWSVVSAANSDDAVAGGWLKRFRAALPSNGDPLDWEELVLVADLPAGTTYIVVDLGASENVVNDDVFPVLHGHYVDAASVVFTQLPPP